MEGVAEDETHAALALLTVMGCDMVQGFLISRPIPRDALVTFLSEDANRHTTMKSRLSSAGWRADGSAGEPAPRARGDPSGGTSPDRGGRDRGSVRPGGRGRQECDARTAQSRARRRGAGAAHGRGGE
ncbi:hypothetical protein AB5I41_30235 [Sphingomonas sp. MMS24-JH45]